MRFRSWLCAPLAAVLAILFVSAAGAHVLINVDKSTQQIGRNNAVELLGVDAP